MKDAKFRYKYKLAVGMQCAVIILETRLVMICLNTCCQKMSLFYLETKSVDNVIFNRIGLCSVLRPRQHSIGYMGDGFYRSKDPTNSIKVLKEKLYLIK